MKLVLGSLVILSLLAGCSSHPIKPEAKNVETSRDDADEDCKKIGKVQGSVSSVKGTFEDALEDLKLDAARKGANFVKIGQTSAMGTSVQGVAYFCP